jgi:integrase/recombinase XerD
MKGVEHPRQKQPIIPTFTLDQITAMLATCSAKTFIDQRDRAIIVLLFDSGLRVSELCGLTMDAINWSEQTMLILGKGNKERLVPFGAMAKQAMLSSMARRGDLATAYFFTTGYGDQLSRRRALEIIQTRGTTAGVKGVRLSPHTIRHTFAVNYLRNGGDVFSLQKMLGHSDLAMTRRYAELSQNDVQAKHRLYSPADSLPQTTAATGRKRLR